MLPKDSALTWYQRIVANEKSGNYEQKVLGLRRIFNSVLLEMFPNISEQAFYCACIDHIFEVKKNRGEFYPAYNKNKREYHQLRVYFNNLMHSKIEADEKGYLIAVRRLSSLINFCSKLEVPADVFSIYDKTDVNSTRLNSDRRKEKHLDNKENREIGLIKAVSPPPTLCIIVDRRNDLQHSQLLEIENGIKTIRENAVKSNINFVVFTIKTHSSILTFPITEKKIRFSFNETYEDEQIKPLRDYFINLHPKVLYLFSLTKASSESKLCIPISLNDSSFLMSIGIVGNGYSNNISDSRNSSRFDKLVLDTNLSSFFDWVVKIINNE